MENIINKLPELEVPPQNPFENDKLGRQVTATTLTNIVSSYANTGCVVALNGEWGTGKTTFLRMWKAQLHKLEYRVIYFNAWEVDYVEDPIVALVSELEEVGCDNKIFKKITGFASKLVLNGLGGIVNNITKSHGLDIKSVIDTATDEFSNSITEYQKTKKSLKDFKKSLGEYVVGKEGDKLPVIFIIDELDRCKPSFAVKLLERIKHLFDIPNIAFVLSMCKSQFECSIKGFYGSENIDASNYLRRFIDLEFELPLPTGEQFFDYLYDAYNFNQYFQKANGNDYTHTYIEIFKNAVKRLFTRTRLDLRTMDKIFAHCRLVAISMGDKPGLMDVVLLLCYLRVVHHDKYKKIQTHSYSLQELLVMLEEVFPKALMNEEICDNQDYHGFTYSCADLLYVYNQNTPQVYEKDILPKDDKEMRLKCTIFTEDKLKEALLYCQRNIDVRVYKFSFLIERMDILQNGL